MSKVLLFLAIAVAAIWFFKGRSRVKGPGEAEARKPPPKPAAPTPMLACAHCGVHLPQTDALHDPQGRAFCSAAHRQAGPR